MADQLTNLYREGKINKYEFDTYLLFGASELGIHYLKNMLDVIVLEEPAKETSIALAKVDGRRSVWRQIKQVVNHVEFLMEGNKNVIDGNFNGYPTNTSNTAQPLFEFHPPSDG